MENNTEGVAVTGVVASSAGHVSIAVTAVALAHEPLCRSASAKVKDVFCTSGRLASNRLGSNTLSQSCEIAQFVFLFF